MKERGRSSLHWPRLALDGQYALALGASRAAPSHRFLFGCGQTDPGAVIQPVLGEWQPHIPERLDEEELADWRAGRNAIYQLAALTVGARLAVADA